MNTDSGRMKCCVLFALRLISVGPFVAHLLPSQRIDADYQRPYLVDSVKLNALLPTPTALKPPPELPPKRSCMPYMNRKQATGIIQTEHETKAKKPWKDLFVKAGLPDLPILPLAKYHLWRSNSRDTCSTTPSLFVADQSKAVVAKRIIIQEDEYIVRYTKAKASEVKCNNAKSYEQHPFRVRRIPNRKENRRIRAETGWSRTPRSLQERNSTIDELSSYDPPRESASLPRRIRLFKSILDFTALRSFLSLKSIQFHRTSFRDIVLSSWSGPVHATTPIHCIQAKLRRLRYDIRAWNRTTFVDIYRNLESAQATLDEIHYEIDVHGYTEERAIRELELSSYRREERWEC
ncbi:unnamed protein product [Striga asiatica]|uniref:Uncharacterized protein n=1 Tax=Striga asiatica TaxID=4170 RepID=A0A5A7Q2D1_STRAF|nr:unnamed protein product [Striga asiatica]